MTARILALWLTALALIAPGGAALAAGRVALVIGNGDYQHVSKLANPRNDAQDIGAALRRLGFDVVVALDTNRKQLHDALADFERRSANSEVALFYFTGWGVEVDGMNWLGVVDMSLKTEADVQRDMLSMDRVVATLQRSPGVRIAMIDGGRDNPFARTGGVQSRDGLARLQTPRGMILVMSSSPGQEALDGPRGGNSPFAKAVLSHIETPDLEIALMMRRLAADVVVATGGKQQPWFSTALADDFFFKRSQNPQASSNLQTAALAEQEADKAWDVIRQTTDREQLRSFVITYPRSRRVGEAFGRLEELALGQKAAPPIPAAPIEPQKRVALVIGNGDYRHARKLDNPKNDATRVAGALKRLGFTVRLELELDKQHFDQVLPEFSEVAAGADLSLVYFAGHAIQLPDAAYVMPVDANPVSRAHIRHQLKSVRDIVSDLENTSGLKLVVIDGCRDNPLAARLYGILGVPRSLGETRGFSIPEVEQRQVGELIVAFATLRGEPAYDGGTEPNSPFTAAFLKHVEADGMDVDRLFRLVTADVKDATRGMQHPEIVTRRSDRPYLLTKPTAASK